jgi:hypothetical protein
MQRLFPSFERRRVRQLLISGQAAILYGASTFSEDVDLWIDPSAGNVARFLHALADLDATVYKLTPPLTRRNVERGHGFHFLVPDEHGPIYLDVMPRPPRVGAFAAAWRRRRVMETPIGPLDVVSLEDLVELKKTRRLADYEVITNLVAIHLREKKSPSRTLLGWAERNSFRATDRTIYARMLGRRRSEADSQKLLLREITRLQRRDTRHWSRVVADLRRMRTRGELLPEGTPVRELIAG